MRATQDDAAGSAYSFAVIGDMPYGQLKFDSLPGFIQFINSDPAVRMTIHVGDIKAGSKAPCTDQLFQSTKAMYDALQRPFVYTPGDNEWTDCHQPIKSNGVFTPTERLAAIRRLFFPVPGWTLGATRVPVHSMKDWGGSYAQFVENVWFTQAGVIFAAVNITGSNDDLAPWGTPLAPDAALWPSQAAERAARLPANVDLIKRAFQEATAANAPGIVLAFQADMWDPAEPSLAGFDRYVQVIGTLARQFGKPVLLLEGDSHVFRADQPFTPQSPFFGLHRETPIAPNVTRLVVSGSGNRTSYIRVTIDPANPALFSWVEVPYL
ncbi:MAG: hypothetical protein HY275_16865 [Gemmatimonadetes bacterium]|nr:hypothetical protein [Gemmatimonadota bacterium]